MTPKRKNNGALWRKQQQRVKHRDTHCHLCGHPINKTLPPLHPWSIEIDHITPLSQGGAEYDLNNLAAAHRLCNQQKGDGTRTAKHHGPVSTSQDWTQ